MNKRVAVISIGTNGTKEEYFQMYRELKKIVSNSIYAKDCRFANNFNTDSEEKTIDDVDLTTMLFIISDELLSHRSAENVFHEIMEDWRENR